MRFYLRAAALPSPCRRSAVSVPYPVLLPCRTPYCFRTIPCAASVPFPYRLRAVSAASVSIRLRRPERRRGFHGSAAGSQARTSAAAGVSALNTMCRHRYGMRPAPVKAMLRNPASRSRMASVLRDQNLIWPPSTMRCSGGPLCRRGRSRGFSGTRGKAW